MIRHPARPEALPSGGHRAPGLPAWGLLAVAVIVWPSPRSLSAPARFGGPSLRTGFPPSPAHGARIRAQDTLPRTYDAIRTPGPIAIDGALDDPAWEAAAWTEDFIDIRGSGPAPSLRTRVKILWDDQFLYVAGEMEEPHLWATLTDRDAIVYRDDDFEVFLDPNGDGLDYFELEINARGTVLDLFLTRPYKDGGKANLEWDLPHLKSGVSLLGTLNDARDVDRGWSAEVAIPWAELAPPAMASAQSPSPRGPRPGDTWRVNFSRVDWPLEVAAGGYRKSALPSDDQPHPEANWVWSPQRVVDMHIPEMWGFVRFVGG